MWESSNINKALEARKECNELLQLIFKETDQSDKAKTLLEQLDFKIIIILESVLSSYNVKFNPELKYKFINKFGIRKKELS